VRAALLVLLAAAASFLPQARAGIEPGADLHALLDAYWSDWLSLNPSLALALGDAGAKRHFDESLTDAWRVRMLAMLDRYSRRTASIRAADLETRDQTSLRMLREQLADAEEFYGGPLFETARRLPIDQFQGPHTIFAADAAGSGNYPFKSADDYRDALVRADRYSEWTDQAISRLSEGLNTGVVLPRLVVERILPQLRAQFGKRAEATEFWHPIEQLPPDMGPLQRRRLERDYRREISLVIEPAYRRLYDFLANEYLPRARSTVGLGEMPGGRALYDYDVRHHTTTATPPNAIHDLGVAEVERIENELGKLRAQVGFSGDLPAFFERVRSDPALKFDARSSIIPAFEAARLRIVAELPRLFNGLPVGAFEIRALPDSSRNSQGNGYYSAPASDGSRPGILWINTYAPGVTDRFNVMTITLHEGLPGHHFQASIAAAQRDLPAFRRFDFTDAYGEGWALYSEALGSELGLYANPWDYYGHLNYAILRANRLVIDTGLHAMGWDVDEGVRWMMAHSSMNDAQARAEVERYVAYPAQALSYKVGELKIRELRRRAERALGGRFDIKAFHDVILTGGSRSLRILEDDVDRWIAAGQ
jgi:uncharacterized protein (DUF885 family)